MRVTTGVVVAAAVAVLAAGCGGDGGGEELSATAFRERANAICRDLAAKNERALDGVDRDDPVAMGRATSEAAKEVERALDELGDLDGPEASEAQLDRFLDRSDQVREALTRYGDALRDGDTAAAERASAEGERLTKELDEAAKAAGLDACDG